MKNNSFEEIYEKLKSSKKVLLSLHVMPDGDSLSSCVSMKYFLERDFGCEVKIISRDDLGETLGNLDFSNDIEFGVDINEINFSEFDVFVSLDSASLKMINFEEENLDKVFVINIDHHVTNSFYGNLNYIGSERNSCASVLIDFFKEVDVEFDSELATRLLLGVCTDSGFFINTNSEDALKDTAFLINKGGKYVDFVLKEVLFKQPLRIKKYGAYLVENFVENNLKNNDFGYSLLPYEKVEEYKLNTAEVRLGISFIQDLDLDFVFTIADIGKGSQKFLLDPKEMLMFLNLRKNSGEGGHEFAAGVELKDVGLEEAKEKVLEVIKNNL